MKLVTVLIVLCFGTTIASSKLYGYEITVIDEWWNADYFLKFNSPSDKTFYISTVDGTIHREKESVAPIVEPNHPRELADTMASETEVPLHVQKNLPFISFVSIDFKIYDISFDNDNINSYHPRLVETDFVCEIKGCLVRPRLESFVGPNKKVYEIYYTDGNELHIAEKSPKVLDHFQIKTFGPFEKWEHTYDFSGNGEIVVDHTISPIPVLANRSILLPELEPAVIESSHNPTVVKFNSPSGRQYYIRDLRNIIAIRHYDEDATAYITFTEPNGRSYDIHIDEEDGHASLVTKSVDPNYFASERLYSFVAPNGILYCIDHKIENDNEVPVLVSSSSDSSDLQVTLTQPGRDFNKRAKYIFSDNGKRLFDRVDEIDWTPLNELPALPVEEVTADYVNTNLPFVSLYTPSGNNYHIFTTNKNASIAVEKGANHSQSLYLSYLQADKRKAHIHFAPGADPYFGDNDNTDRSDESLTYYKLELLSFGTPDRKEYSIYLSKDEGSGIRKYVIEQRKFEEVLQVEEPDDAPEENGLFIRIRVGMAAKFIYRFTWNGDKLVEAFSERVYHHTLPIGKQIISLIGK